ncbi:putative tRNA (guanine(26)-N(2))-dimethyltransferase 2, partial [Cucurbita argyrosperma subsp. argyrosperma]
MQRMEMKIEEGLIRELCLEASEVKNHPVKAKPEDQPGIIILAKVLKAQARKFARFLPNPERHWGSKLRAGRQITSVYISLLDAEAIIGALSHTDYEKPKAQRPKVEDESAPNQ